MSDPNVLGDFSGPWLDRVRRGHKVWLVKEGQLVTIAADWEPPEPGHRSGMIFIRRAESCIEHWYVDNYGRGINGSLIMCPVEGNLMDSPHDFTANEVAKMRNDIYNIHRRLNLLEQILLTTAIFDAKKCQGQVIADDDQDSRN